MKKTTLLVILDGFGLNPSTEGNSVALAKKPTIDSLLKTFPNSTLITFGERVGLPDGQMGNSEVGHLNIGAGAVIEQWLLRISRALSGNFLDNSVSYKNFIERADTGTGIHIVGLYSGGGVHSHKDHLKLLLRRIRQDSSSEIFLHLISDGRDTSPTIFENDLKDLSNFLKTIPNCKIATISGRFYAMDRDKRWERVLKAYQAIVLGEGVKTDNAENYVQSCYKKGITDEFLEPAILYSRPFLPTDSVIFWNFREDRMREIVAAICTEDFNGFERPVLPVTKERTLGFTDYDHKFGLPYIFSAIEIKNHLGETVSKAGLKQLRVAETEKYPHVTYFLNGGIETPYPGEDRKLIPSPRDVKTYDLKPEMSAYEVTEVVVDAINSGIYELIVVNLANCDMVGHSGVLDAGIKAVETVDICLGQMLSALKKVDGQAVILADHGNAEQMVNYIDGTPHTAHTTYPVPIIVVSPRVSKLASGGALCDVAPTVLDLMDLPKPSEMTGRSLISKRTNVDN